jgi:hypothetical protein
METKLSMALPLCYDCRLVRHNDYSCTVSLGYCLDCCGCPAHLVSVARPKAHLGLFSVSKIKSQVVNLRGWANANPPKAYTFGLLLGLLVGEVIL